MADARKPDYQIYDDGAKVQDDVKATVISITVDERVDQASVCTIELLDEGARMSDGKRWKVGSELRVELGYVGGTRSVFEGEITGWRGAFPRRGPQTLVVMALDRFHRMRRERKRRSFLKMKDSEIVQKIAGDHGFSVETKPTRPAHDYVVQFNKSDADFLLERAALNGYELFIDGRKMIFRAPSVDSAPVATLKWHEGLKSFAPTISLGKAHSAVKATSYSMKEKKQISVTAKKGDEISLMGGSKTGADLSAKLGSEPYHDPMQPMLSADEAEALARGTLNRDAMRLVTGEGASQGNNLIRRDTVIEVDAIGDLLSGRYYVATALHSLLPGHGYTTTFRVRRTAIAKPPEPPAKKVPPAPAKAATPEPAAGNVEFVVKNQFGEAVEGLAYILYCPDGEKKTGTLPANGVVTEPNAKGGVYRLAIKGVDPPILRFEDAPEEPLPKAPPIAPAAPKKDERATASVKLSDEKGAPMANVPFEFSYAKTKLTATTGADGVASVKLPKGTPPESVKVKVTNPAALDQSEVAINLGIDPAAAAAAEDKFILKASDGSYTSELTLKDDHVPGDDHVTLVFKGLDPSKTYSLEVVEAGVTTRILENVPYASLGSPPAAAKQPDPAPPHQGTVAGGESVATKWQPDIFGTDAGGPA